VRTSSEPAGPAAHTTYLPHVVAWNLTRRCNLECAHCYISAGPSRASGDELSTERCLELVDQILSVNPAPMLILTGGEPLVREDIEAIVHKAAAGGATVVLGTNGTLLTTGRIDSLRQAGLLGVAVSIDSLEARYHDRFRHGHGALAATLAAVEALREARLDFVVQTTVTRGNRRELGALAAWSADKGAVAFNVYFVVQTGRAGGMEGLSPVQNEVVLQELVDLERQYRGRMMVRSKCQPAMMRKVYETDPESTLLNYETRCPCGVHYCRIAPDGKVTPCPFMPAVAGDLREHDFATIWSGSPIFRRLRDGRLTGKCGRCEYREICGGCRARGFATTGDLMGADEACAYEPDGRRKPVARLRPVAYGEVVERELAWAPDAARRLERIPSFVRAVVTRRVEGYAREKGIATVTADLLDEIRGSMPVDFSKRLPFFLRDEH
jgi:radical SAM protein with 4Fe4S-binding SPASM domain